MIETELGVEMYLWKNYFYIIYDAKNNDQANLLWAYRLTINKCTEEFRTKLQAEDRYEEITSSGYVIELLKIIKNKPYRYQIHKYLPKYILEALRNFHTTSQEKSATCSEYLKKFQTAVDVIKYVG